MDRPNPWLSWDYVERNWEDILAALRTHTSLTLQAVGIALVIAFPLAALAHQNRRLTAPILGLSSALYTVPSLALFALLAPITGIRRTTVLIGLVMYALVMLVRNILVGLNGVDRDVVDAARGMGYSRMRILFAVEVPNALPSIFAGLRVATVTTVALTTVGVVVGYGGLGQLMFRGFYRGYHAEIATAGLLCVLLALTLDLLLLGISKATMPWLRGRHP